MNGRPFEKAFRLGVLLAATTALSCMSARNRARSPLPQPQAIAHAAWESSPPLGHAGVGTRRNIPAGSRLEFADLVIHVDAIARSSVAGADTIRLRLARGSELQERVALEGEAFNWSGYHIAVVAAPSPGELGGGLVALEVARVGSIPAAVASSRIAGGAALRLRVPHEITHVTLHHTGSAEPLRPDEDPAAKLRGLQSWGASDRNWWDVPYHFLIDLEGRIYEGRDWRYMGETNTTYDPRGHLLISIIGNYGRQEATAAQLEAIADMMAWGISQFDVPLERIGGHYHYAETSCPGTHLRKYLEDGTFRRMVEQRLGR